MSQIKGKQLADAPNGITTAKINTDAVTTAKILDANITTSKLAAGVLSADAAGRGKFAAGLFDSATVTSVFAAASIALSKLAEAVIEADGGQAFTANQSMGGFKLTNVGTPTVGTDAANKDYIDNAIAGLAWKDSVRIATTANTALSGLLTIDGITLLTGERILVKNQTTASENGIYTAASGAWTRSTDADAADELDAAAVFVEEGTANANSMWTQTGDGGTFAVNSVWVLFSTVGTIIGGAGILRTGDTLDIELATLSGLEFDAGGVGGKLRLKFPALGGVVFVNGSGEVQANFDTKTITTNSGGVLRANYPVGVNKNALSAAAAGEGSTTGLTIAVTPAENNSQGGQIPHVRILVNGTGQRLGNGTKVGVDCYFSVDAGVTARAYISITAGDTLFWNATTAGFALETTDVVDMDYNTK